MSETPGRTIGRAITDADVEALRRTIGVESPMPQYNTVASEDAIRHYVLGIGDDNPRWLDRDYAAKTRWGAILALPTFVMSCGFARSRGLAGVHGLFTGIDLHCHEPIRAGTPVRGTSALHDLIERQGRYAGREFQQISVSHFRDEAGRELSTLYSHAFRVERTAGKKKGKYAGIERQRYTKDDLASIEADYERERRERRGAVPRYWEDVAVGDAITPVVKGPLTVTDCICFLMGFGYIYVRAHRQWYEFRKRHPGANVPDSYGVPDIPERVHWEEELPRQIGMPTAYDYGPQRIAWFDHCIHDWMGDDGWMKRLQVTLSEPNFIGDTTWIRGEVTACSAEDSSVTVAMRAVDQRGRVTATAESLVVLPRRPMAR